MRSAATIRERRGFTLIEMLVVYIVLFVLVSLILPSVLNARSQARRIRCQNNLSAIGLALRTYDSAHTILPPGVINHSGPIQSVADTKQLHISWISMILPQLEQHDWYKQQDFSVSVYHKKHDDYRQTPFPMFSCPTTSGGNRYSSYAGVHHYRETPIDHSNDGVLFLNSSVDLEDIPDGAGNTMLAAEKDVPASDLGWISGTRSTLRNTGSSISNATGKFQVYDYINSELEQLTFICSRGLC